jgi:hypothetical protein
LAVEQAQLRDPDAREHQRREEHRARYVVAPPGRLSSPDFAAPDRSMAVLVRSSS